MTNTELLNTQSNVEETDNKVYSKEEREQYVTNVEGTPFSIVKEKEEEEKYFIALGTYRVMDGFEKIGQAEQFIANQNLNWEFMTNVISVVVEAVTEIKK